MGEIGKFKKKCSTIFYYYVFNETVRFRNFNFDINVTSKMQTGTNNFFI